MLEFAFVSRHAPTPHQKELAAELGVSLTHAGDMDAFSPKEWLFETTPGFGVVVVHPLLALRAANEGLLVGVFNNVNRAAVGEKPQFETTELWVMASGKRLLTAADVAAACEAGE